MIVAWLMHGEQGYRTSIDGHIINYNKNRNKLHGKEGMEIVKEQDLPHSVSSPNIVIMSHKHHILSVTSLGMLRCIKDSDAWASRFWAMISCYGDIWAMLEGGLGGRELGLKLFRLLLSVWKNKILVQWNVFLNTPNSPPPPPHL